MMADTPARSFRLSRSQRIKHRRDFDRARTLGSRLVQGCLILNWFILPAGSKSRLGVVTSKKLGNAVVRTRARRLMREAFRLNQKNLAQPVDMVLVGRQSIVEKHLSKVEADLVRALKTANLWKETV